VFFLNASSSETPSKQELKVMPDTRLGIVAHTRKSTMKSERTARFVKANLKAVLELGEEECRGAAEHCEL
jgi:O-succinylbenzoate synthase